MIEMERNKFPKTPSPHREGFHPDEYPIVKWVTALNYESDCNHIFSGESHMKDEIHLI